jgi:UDP-N-acetylmuramyl pentapeptide phosphotransferase/UDP-N-acetylglucosamine-1-phosphate transferase
MAILAGWAIRAVGIGPASTVLAAICRRKSRVFVTTLGPLLFVSAAALSAGLILLLQPLLRRYALARPNARSSHREPTPQGGGIAVIAATIAVTAVALLAVQEPDAGAFVRLSSVLAAAAFIAVIGAVDDIRTIGVGPRLLFQTLAVIAAVAALPAELRALPFVPWWVERAILVLGSIWFVNLTNFMDGIDWMTVAEVVPITGGLVLLGALGALPLHGILVALVLGGAVIGFAPFNRPVAKLFLGDVGSLPIGLLLAWLLIVLAGQGHLAAAFLLPLYYLADATATPVRRLLNGEQVWQAHRTHFYQRALDKGLTVPQIVSRVFAVNVVLVGLAAMTILVPTTAAAIATVAVGGAAVVALLFELVRRRT